MIYFPWGKCGSLGAGKAVTEARGIPWDGGERRVPDECQVSDTLTKVLPSADPVTKESSWGNVVEVITERGRIVASKYSRGSGRQRRRERM